MTDLAHHPAPAFAVGETPDVESVSVLTVLKQVWALLLSMAMLMAGAGLQSSLLGVRGPIEGFSVSTLGVILAAYFLGYVAGSYAIPPVIQSVGHVRTFSGLASLASVVMLVHGIWLQSGAWLVLRFVTGACIAGLFIVAESWLGAAGDHRSRGTLLAIYMVVVTGSLAGSQLLLNVASVSGPVLFVVASAAVSLAVVPLSLVPQPPPPLGDADPYPLRRLVRDAPLAGLAGAVSGMGTAAMFGFGAVEAAALGFDLSGVSLFVAAVPAGSVLLQIPLGRFSDHTDRRRVIACTAGVGVVAALAGGFASGSPRLLVFVGLAFVLGGVVFPLYSLAVAHMNDYLDPAHIVSAGAKMIVLNGLAAAASQVLAGVVVDVAGPDGFFWYLAVVLGTVVAYALYRLTRRDPAVDPGEFAPVPYLLTTPGVELNAEAAHDGDLADPDDTWTD